jgi:hypothetical protein
VKWIHAAALVLTAWYLMVPPTIPNTNRVNKSVPLAQWTIRRTFPRNAGCEAAKDRLVQKALAAHSEANAGGRHGNGNLELSCVGCNAQCVEDDDPRLKEK